MSIEDYLAWESEQYEKYGWIIHYVPDEQSATRTNIHTHGLVDKYGHLDLQITVPIPEKVAKALLWTVVDRIAEGEQFLPGERYSEVIKGFDVKCVLASECGRSVVRIILPDKYGGLDKGDFKDENFGLQYEGVS